MQEGKKSNKCNYISARLDPGAEIFTANIFLDFQAKDILLKIMKEKILILDPKRKADYKISKDTSGGYGTGNDFGNSIVPRILKNLLKKYSNWPPLFAGYTFSVLEMVMCRDSPYQF